MEVFAKILCFCVHTFFASGIITLSNPTRCNRSCSSVFFSYAITFKMNLKQRNRISMVPFKLRFSYCTMYAYTPCGNRPDGYWSSWKGKGTGAFSPLLISCTGSLRKLKSSVIAFQRAPRQWPGTWRQLPKSYPPWSIRPGHWIFLKVKPYGLTCTLKTKC